MPYSPLASGRLARTQWDGDSVRSKTDTFAKAKYDHTKDHDLGVVARVKELSEKYHCKMSELSLAWLWHKGVASPIVGAGKLSHIDDAVNALEIKLTDEDVAYLEELYYPHPVVGALSKNYEAKPAFIK